MSIKNDEVKRILVIRFRRVGDAVLSTALCSTLKNSFPQASIDYVLNEGIAPLFQYHPDIDNIITFNEKEMSNLWNYTRKIRNIMHQGKYNMIVDTRSTVKTLWFSLFSLKTPYRVGRKKAYNKLVQNYTTKNGDGSDMVCLTLKLLQPLEKKFQIKYNRNFKVYVTEDEKTLFSEYLVSKGVNIQKPIITCAVATRIPHKMWDFQLMKDTLLQILNQYKDVQLIFNYAGKEEKDISEQLHKEMNNHLRVFSNIDAKSLRELACMIKLSSFFFGNEGGPRHISQALEVPSFAIYPPGISKKTWLPNNSDHYQGIALEDISPEQAISKKLSYKQKMDLITLDKVWSGLSPMLEKHIE
ncbi:glycosyltransferase family 9 protein [Bacteroides sp. 51]|uniref:glycosyltransferase family 9 protein n=1 Tax=Bacteroides sp. 51 TaxID=2302938 RepID=UPI0013D4ED78|nr:glycosyltransferase family 9 protein [Bacteroides sp. 51]NDV81492.1 lipopolysaccharide heptosyltransferase family protein [Bacteroides sp. 51]